MIIAGPPKHYQGDPCPCCGSMTLVEAKGGRECVTCRWRDAGRRRWVARYNSGRR